jgi:FKBP-type peptidyl-prolyl cis-trans isomerase 2
MSKAEKGNTVKVHYQGTFSDGEQFDSSFDRGEPISFTVGQGQMIPGFDSATVGMKVGETKNITLGPEEAYGARDETAIQIVPKDLFPESFEFNIGETVQGTNSLGTPLVARLLSEQTETVTLDFNHPLSGRELNFKIELVDIEGTTE